MRLEQFPVGAAHTSEPGGIGEQCTYSLAQRARIARSKLQAVLGRGDDLVECTDRRHCKRCTAAQCLEHSDWKSFVAFGRDDQALCRSQQREYLIARLK